MFAKIANEVLELVVREEEIVQLDRRIVLFVAVLDFLCPHGAVDVDELIDLEWDQAPRDRPFAVQAAKDAFQSNLWVLNEDVLFLAELSADIYS